MISRLASNDFGRNGGLVLALGVATYTVNANAPTIKQRTGVDISLFNYDVVFYVAFTCIVAGAIIVLLWLIAFIIQHTFVLGARVAMDKFSRATRKFSTLRLESCNDSDVNTISQMASQQFGAMAADLARNQWLKSIDSDSYMKVVDGNGKIVGFYGIFRLTRMGRNAAQSGEFSIITCPREYLRSDGKHKYANVYLGGVYGKNKLSRGMVVGAINQELYRTKTKQIFARAATDDGLRLLRNSGFEPVDPTKRGLGEMFSRSGY